MTRTRKIQIGLGTVIILLLACIGIGYAVDFRTARTHGVQAAFNYQPTATPDRIAALSEQLSSMQDDIDALKATPTAIATVQPLASTARTTETLILTNPTAGVILSGDPNLFQGVNLVVTRMGGMNHYAQGSKTLTTTYDMAPQLPQNADGESYYGATTADVQQLTGLSVQRVTSEPAAWTWRGAPNSAPFHCPADMGYICTITLDGEGSFVYSMNADYQIIAVTIRQIHGFPIGDAVRESLPIQLTLKEDLNGLREQPSFDVNPGDFVPGWTIQAIDPKTIVTAPGASGATNSTCPQFAGRALKDLNGDGSQCKLEYNATIGESTGIVPAGYSVQYWNGTATIDAKTGETITTGEATFNKN